MALIRLLVAPLTFSLVSAVPRWSQSHQVNARRLDLEITKSSSDVKDSSCIVAGYDAEKPAHVFVGGPCSELSGSGDDLKPAAGFRWVEMETVHAKIVTESDDDVPLKQISGKSFSRAMQEANFDSISTGTHMVLDNETYKNAGFFMSVTSYLSKAQFDYDTNDFTIEQDSSDNWKEVKDVCVTDCCAASDAPCECQTCAADKRTAKPGDYKFSILAAAFNGEDASAEGNGWEKVRDDHGSRRLKTLKGSFRVYQTIDFTNMKADNLEVVNSAGSVLYAGMTPCDLLGESGCKEYPVSSLKVKSDKWEGMYDFIGTYNVGEWTETATGLGTKDSYTTRSANIACVKPDPATLKALGYEGKKVILVEYKFDITGIMASSNSGKYMVYDPTVRTLSGGTTRGATAAVTTQGGKAPTTTQPTTAAGAMSIRANFIFIFVAVCFAGLSPS